MKQLKHRTKYIKQCLSRHFPSGNEGQWSLLSEPYNFLRLQPRCFQVMAQHGEKYWKEMTQTQSSGFIEPSGWSWSQQKSRLARVYKAKYWSEESCKEWTDYSVSPWSVQLNSTEATHVIKLPKAGETTNQKDLRESCLENTESWE